MVGGFIAQMLGVGTTSGVDWIKLLIQVAVAALAIVLWMNHRKEGA